MKHIFIAQNYLNHWILLCVYVYIHVYFFFFFAMMLPRINLIGNIIFLRFFLVSTFHRIGLLIHRILHDFVYPLQSNCPCVHLFTSWLVHFFIMKLMTAASQNVGNPGTNSFFRLYRKWRRGSRSTGWAFLYSLLPACNCLSLCFRQAQGYDFCFGWWRKWEKVYWQPM